MVQRLSILCSKSGTSRAGISLLLLVKVKLELYSFHYLGGWNQIHVPRRVAQPIAEYHGSLDLVLHSVAVGLCPSRDGCLPPLHGCSAFGSICGLPYELVCANEPEAIEGISFPF